MLRYIIIINICAKTFVNTAAYFESGFVEYAQVYVEIVSGVGCVAQESANLIEGHMKGLGFRISIDTAGNQGEGDAGTPLPCREFHRIAIARTQQTFFIMLAVSPYRACGMNHIA